MPVHRPDLDLEPVEPRQASDRPDGPERRASFGAGATPAVDWAFVAEALDGLPPAAVDALMAEVLADARRSLAALRDPALPDDARARLAHRLKGSARTFGLAGLGAAAAAIEAAAEDGHHLWPALDAYAEALEVATALLATGRPPVPRRSRGARH